MQDVANIEGEDVTLIRATELGIDADQERLGIVKAVEIIWEDMTLVVARTNETMYVYGASIRNPVKPNRPMMARATAWQRALESLLRNRDKFLARRMAFQQKVRV